MSQKKKKNLFLPGSFFHQFSKRRFKPATWPGYQVSDTPDSRFLKIMLHLKIVHSIITNYVTSYKLFYFLKIISYFLKIIFFLKNDVFFF